MLEPNAAAPLVLRDGEEYLIHADGQTWAASWHPPDTPPDGRPHGATGVCVTGAGDVVLISTDGEHWDLPAGRPEGDETWEQTLRREMLEEACARVRHARLLGFSRGVCLEGHEQGLVLVRSVCRADVDLEPWDPQFEIPHRRLVSADELRILPVGGVFVPLIRRAFREAGVL
jgi:ADP-ribose pyrophosphatase YjhB (NUDIX family)